MLLDLITRASEDQMSVEFDEASCLGWCKRAPCVAVEHEDYVGRIGLEGMDDSEIAQKCFFGVDNDGGRVWEAVKEGVEQMVDAAED